MCVCMRVPMSVCLYVCGQQERQSQVQCHLDCCWCLTSTETIRLIRDGEKAEEGGIAVGR